MNPGSVQQGTNAQVRVVNSLTNAVVIPGQSASSSSAHQKPHAILQPLQSAYPGGQSLIVTIANHNGNESKNHDGVQQVIHQQNYNDYGQYVTVCGGNYYQGSGASSLMSSNMSTQLVAQSGENYLVHGSVDASGQIAHTIRASPATVQWLLENYETAESVSLPRSTLYNHYIRHCTEHKLDPMNPASFGKLIRSVFPGLRTRRLGTRGNSQYHYYGIRIKSMSPLNQVGCDGLLMSRQHVFSQAKRFKTDGDDGGISVGDSSQPSQSSVAGMSSSQQQQQHLQYLGDTSAALPDFGHVTLSAGEQFPRGVTAEHILAFEQLYREHCEAFLEIIINLQFQLVETLWMSFWRKVHAGNLESDTEQQLPTDKLHLLCGMTAVQEYVRQTDYIFYQTIVGILVPDVLRPIPSQLTQAIRNFAKNLEGWLKNALVGTPDDIVRIKVNAVRALAQILRRYTSLNHLAQAARAVLQNSNQITQMLADINKVDFTSVQEQASWVCRCDDAVVHHLEQDFKKTLQQQTPLEQWAAWLEHVVNDALAPYASSPDFPERARQFLMKWSFYSSMVIRDLTLRSAASFGSFHLIRLLYDEYMFYIVEHKIAAAMQETSIAVMANYRQLLDIGPLSHDMTIDGSMMLSTGPLSMTVDTETLAAAAADSVVSVAASSAAVAMTPGRHLATK